MEVILFGFLAITLVVLFFGSAMARLISSYLDEDSNRIIQQAQSMSERNAYASKQQAGLQRGQSVRSVPTGQPRTYQNRRHSSSVTTEESRTH